jgi:hypothetical protein
VRRRLPLPLFSTVLGEHGEKIEGKEHPRGLANPEPFL